MTDARIGGQVAQVLVTHDDPDARVGGEVAQVLVTHTNPDSRVGGIVVQVLVADVAITGSASGTLTISASASGSPNFKGSASGTLTINGTASGSPYFKGSASGSLTINGTASGFAESTGSASGSLTISASASGFTESTGSASGTLTINGAASGSPVLIGSASGSLTLTGSAAGSAVLTGSASGTLTIGGTASGYAPSLGSASGVLYISGSASGVGPIPPPPPEPLHGLLQGFCASTIEGDLVLNGIPMKTSAWMCFDLTPLWTPADVRGIDRIVPMASGVYPYRRRTTSTVYSLDFSVAGFSSLAGVVTTGTGNGYEEFRQLEYNLDFLRLNVIDPRTDPNPDGTVLGELTMPSGEIRTANVHVLGFTVNVRVSHMLHGVLDISIPSGGFV